jgi:hypothetical protein
MNNLQLDVYRLYKRFYQRSHRDKYDEDLAEMTEIAKEIARKTFLEELHNKKNASNRRATLLMAKRLENLEADSRFGINFSAGLVAAIKSNNYYSNVPYERRHSWQAINNFEGFLYLFTSSSKPNQVKLGATYMDPYDRARKYSSKFGYQVDLLVEATVKNPWEAEIQLGDLLKDKRVAGNTWGDSNEWYFLKKIEAKRIFKEFVATYSVNCD